MADGTVRVVLADDQALNNAVAHAEAEHVRIDVVERDGELTIAVADDGRGFDPAVRTGGFGLLGMRERVKLAGGSMETRTAPSEGTTVRATLAARHRVAAKAG